MKLVWYKNNVKFLYKTNFAVVLILPLFLDEILMPWDSPPIMQAALFITCCLTVTTHPVLNAFMLHPGGVARNYI